MSTLKINHKFAFLNVLGVGAALRVLMLHADPPAWMPEAFFIDGGWWLGSARTAHFFQDYLLQDFGMSFFVCPLYTWANQIIFKWFSAGWAQSLLISGFSQVAVIGLVGFIMGRSMGAKAAILSSLILALSPLYVMHGRAPLPESFQSLFLLLSAGCLLLNKPLPVLLFVAGLFAGAAILVKFNAVLFGVVPIFVASFVSDFSLLDKDKAERKRSIITGHALFAISCALPPLLFVGILPLLGVTSFLDVFIAETGTANFHEYFTFFGRMFVSLRYTEEEVIPVLWNVIRYSPLLFVIVWYAFVKILSVPYSAMPDLLKSLSRVDVFALSWLSAGIIINSITRFPSDYRMISLYPPAAMIASSLICGHLGRDTDRRKPNGTYRFIQRVGLAFVCMFPAFVLLKAPMTKVVMNYFRAHSIGSFPGLGISMSGMPFAMIWVLFLCALAKGVRIELFFARMPKLPIQWITLVLVSTEVVVLISYFLFPTTTIDVAQRDLATKLDSSSLIADNSAAILLFRSGVIPVRRSTLNDYSLVKVIEHKKPRYAFAVARRDYFDYSQSHFRLRTFLLDHGYTLRERIKIGPVWKKRHRYEIDLFEKNNT